MVPNGDSSLVIRSTTLTSAQITEVLGLPATQTAERGDVRSHKLQLVREDSLWRLDGEPNANPTDQTGFGSMRNLLAALEGKGRALETLRESCDIFLDWHGFSDSEQGGFVIPADVLRAAAELGCDLFGTVYLDADADADGDERAGRGDE